VSYTQIASQHTCPVAS